MAANSLKPEKGGWVSVNLRSGRCRRVKAEVPPPESSWRLSVEWKKSLGSVAARDCMNRPSVSSISSTRTAISSLRLSASR